jgi:hypothetical protein
MARIYSNFSHCSKKSSMSPPDPRVSLIGQKRNIPNYFKSLPLRVPSFVFRHISCCKIAEIQSQSIKAKLPVPTWHASVTGKSAACPAFLPVAGAGRQADRVIISTLPRSPTLCLPAGRQGREASLFLWVHQDLLWDRCEYLWSMTKFN